MDADKQCGLCSKAVHFLKDTFTPPPCPLPVAGGRIVRPLRPHGEVRARTSLALTGVSGRAAKPPAATISALHLSHLRVLEESLQQFAMVLRPTDRAQGDDDGIPRFHLTLIVDL